MKNKRTKKTEREEEFPYKRERAKTTPKRRRPITMEEAEQELMMEFGSLPDGMGRRSKRTRGWYDD